MPFGNLIGVLRFGFEFFLVSISSLAFCRSALDGLFYYLLGWKHEYGYSSNTTAMDIATHCKSHISNRTAIVTGANSGLGLATATALAANGCSVIMACRNMEKAKAAYKEIKSKYPNAKLLPMHLDVSELKSVRKFANDIRQSNKPVSILINNAGIAFCKASASKDGFELQFATNFLGHYVLTQLLLPILHKNGPSRIVNVSSIAHGLVGSKRRPDWNAYLNYHKSDQYSPFKSYAHSKLAQILQTRIVARYIEDNGLNVTMNAIHPGSILESGITQHQVSEKDFLVESAMKMVGMFFKTSEQGAATQVLVACHPALAKANGLYFQDCGLTTPHKWARDDTVARELEKFCDKFVPKVRQLS